MNTFPSCFASLVATILIPAAACAQSELRPHTLPYENGTLNPLDGAKPSIVITHPLPYENGTLDPLDGPKPPIVIVRDPLPDDNGTIDHLDYHTSLYPPAVTPPVFGPANFLSPVTGARGRAYGTLKVDVSATGTFTAVLRLAKNVYRFRGTLDENGTAGAALMPRSASRISIRVQVKDGHLSAGLAKGSLYFSVE